MQDGIFLSELGMPRPFGYASRMAKPTLARNITALRKHLGMTQVEFADQVETQQANVSKWERGVEPTALSMAKMAELAGVGVRAFSEQEWIPEGYPKSSPEPQSSLADLAAENGWVLIEEVDLDLGMGATFLDAQREPQTLGYVPFRSDWLRNVSISSVAKLRIVRGKGDSMEPTIRDGDFVLIDTNRQSLDEQDAIWAVSFGELGMIRRLRQMPGGTVLLMPDNPHIRPAEASDGELYIMGRVIWIGRRM